jgi:glucokinase
MTAWAIGIDVGGSAIKLGLIGPAGQVVRNTALPMVTTQGFAEFAARIAGALAGLLDGADVTPRAIGIATPGYPDLATGWLAEGGANVAPMQGGSLPAYLQARFGLAVTIENDGVCAANGEMRFGPWQRFARYAVATVGTGVGGALVIDGRLLVGRGGLAPEFGAICLDPAIPPERGPVPGRLDKLGSAAALVRRYRALSPKAEAAAARVVVELAETGNDAAVQAVEETARWLAQAFGIMCNIANLDAVVMGGGLSASSYFLARVAHHMTSFVWPSARRKPELVMAAHGNNAGLVGAAAFALDAVACQDG